MDGPLTVRRVNKREWVLTVHFKLAQFLFCEKYPSLRPLLFLCVKCGASRVLVGRLTFVFLRAGLGDPGVNTGSGRFSIKGR